MNRKNIARGALGGLGIVVVLGLVAGFVLPRFVDLAPYKAQIVTRLSEGLGGDVTLRGLRLSVWPLPHVVLEGVHFSVPQRVDGTLTRVSVYPRLLSLMTGTLRPATVRIDRPDITVQVPPSPGSHAPLAVESIAGLQDAFGAALAAVSSTATQAPGLLVVVTHGTVGVSGRSDPSLSFTDVHARVHLPPGPFSFDVTCTSNIWRRLSSSASLDPVTITGTGRVDLVGLRPQRLAGDLFADGALRLEDSEVNLAAGLQFGGPTVLAAAIDASIPVLAFHRGTQRLAIKGDRLKATLQIDERATTVTVSDIRLQSPALQLSGKMSIDHSAVLTSLELEARDVDVSAVREAATVIAGEEHIVAEIFDIVRGGKVPQLVVRASGRALSELGGRDALTVQGTLVEGRIHVPGAALDFDDVAGAALVTRGVLTGDQLAARLGKSHVLSGTLRVGLEGEAPDLHVAATAQADAAELRALLTRWIVHEPVRHVLDRINDVEGAATGALTIDGTTKALNVTADVSHIDVSGRVEGLVRPLRVYGGRVVYDDGRLTASGLQVAMTESDLTASVDLAWSADEVDVKHLHLHDAHADAMLALRMKPTALDLQFKGSLDKQTVDLVVPENTLLRGWLRGDFRTHVPLNDPQSSTAQGTLEAHDVVLSTRADEPLRIDRLSLAAGAGKVRADAALDAGADGAVQFHGSVRPGPRAFLIDLDVTAGRLNWGRINDQLALGASADTARIPSLRDLSLVGTLRVSAESFTYGRWTWKPVRALVALRPSGAHVTVTEATLCGIATPGKLRLTPRGVELAFKPVAHSQPLDAMLTCLANRSGSVTGSYSLAAEVRAQGKPADLVTSLQGHAQFTATDGRISRIGMLAKVFSMLSIVTGSVGNLLDLRTDALPYDTINMKGDLHGATLQLSEAVLDGPTVKMVCEGSADVNDQTLDLTLLVAPLRTVDTVVSHIPIVSGVLGGSLVSIPVRVSGPIDDPEVIPLSPSAVGKGLLGFMSRTLKLPWRLIQPLLPSTEKPK